MSSNSRFCQYSTEIFLKISRNPPSNESRAGEGESGTVFSNLIVRRNLPKKLPELRAHGVLALRNILHNIPLTTVLVNRSFPSLTTRRKTCAELRSVLRIHKLAENPSYFELPGICQLRTIERNLLRPKIQVRFLEIM